MKKLLFALGLCRKAGALTCGTPMICAELPKGRILLVVESSDTSDGTHKKLTDKCLYYGVKHLRISADGERLAAAVGKTGFLASVGVSDKNLAGLVESACMEETTNC